MDRKNILLEGVVIVLSILLAFGIDAMWDEYKERKEERQILDALQFEFQANLESINAVIRFHVGAGNRVNDMVKRTETEIRALDQKALSEFIKDLCNPWTFDAVLGTTDALIGAGKLEILEDHRLRVALTTFLNVVQDAVEDADFIGRDAERLWVAEIEAGGPWTDPETEVGLKGDTILAPEFIAPPSADDVLRVRSDQDLMGIVGRCHLNVGYYLTEVYRMREEAARVLELIEESEL